MVLYPQIEVQALLSKLSELHVTILICWARAMTDFAHDQLPLTSRTEIHP